MSRVYRIGTIYSRVEGLIRKGHMNEIDRPLWFDLYSRFPPKYEPSMARVIPEVKVREIFYEEDRLRAKIHKELQKKLGTFNLMNKGETRSQKYMKECQELMSKGMTEEEAIKKITGEQNETMTT